MCEQRLVLAVQRAGGFTAELRVGAKLLQQQAQTAQVARQGRIVVALGIGQQFE